MSGMSRQRTKDSVKRWIRKQKNRFNAFAYDCFASLSLFVVNEIEKRNESKRE